MKPPKGMEAMKPQGYVRVKDRKTAPVPVAQKPIEEEPPQYEAYDDHGITDEDVPF